MKEPFSTNDKDTVYKIMLHTVKRGAFIYLYTSSEADSGSFDLWYDSADEALDEWDSEISGEWNAVPDNPPDGYSDSYIG